MINTIYYNRYLKIVNHYLINVPSECFTEKHHILPKCLGGTDESSNIVILPARAHIICHYLLHLAYPENSSLAHAFAMMTVNNGYQGRLFSSRLYEASKMARSHALKGRPRSESVKIRMRKPKKSNVGYIGNKNALGNRFKHTTPRTENHIKNIKKSLELHWNNKKIFTKNKIENLRKEFKMSGLSRKDFAIKHLLSYSTIKRYLVGL